MQITVSAGIWSSPSPTTDISPPSACGSVVDMTRAATRSSRPLASREETITMCSPWPSRRQASAACAPKSRVGTTNSTSLAPSSSATRIDTSVLPVPVADTNSPRVPARRRCRTSRLTALT